MRRPVELRQIKVEDDAMKGFALLKQPRLSVVPVLEGIWERIVRWAADTERRRRRRMRRQRRRFHHHHHLHQLTNESRRIGFRKSGNPRNLKLFNSNKERKGKKKPTWEVVKGPRQPDAKQYGFYVMKFMREIIEGNVTGEKDSLSSMMILQRVELVKMLSCRTRTTR
ncbi:uncharacterized protein LOC121969979 isoform X1 [Zingiber officinale]|uniref:uncharacterized protein LOC121969979 isoform X1 n=1 Tax=Zingiber officinale TaxID=94328 RepID=UPI001C4C61BE|nr:uncharacterized protein LOC121969979 isoform X1 [Zingiber officinale]